MLSSYKCQKACIVEPGEGLESCWRKLCEYVSHQQVMVPSQPFRR